MSNKVTIRRAPQPVTKPKEEKKSAPAKRQMSLVGIIPAVIFVGIAIWYFLSSMK